MVLPSPRLSAPLSQFGREEGERARIAISEHNLVLLSTISQSEKNFRAGITPTLANTRLTWLSLKGVVEVRHYSKPNLQECEHQNLLPQDCYSRFLYLSKQARLHPNVPRQVYL